MRWVKRYGGGLVALGALRVDLEVMAFTTAAARFDGLEPAILRTFARLAAFGWIEKILVAEKYLLADSPDEGL